MEGISSPRENDNYAPGQRADGTIVTMTPDQALKAIGERDAYEEAFDDDADVSDLDDDIPE